MASNNEEIEALGAIRFAKELLAGASLAALGRLHWITLVLLSERGIITRNEANRLNDEMVARARALNKRAEASQN